MLELVERLADLHIKRARTHELEETAQRLNMRQKVRIYHRASKLLHAEILRIEGLIEQGL